MEQKKGQDALAEARAKAEAEARAKAEAEEKAVKEALAEVGEPSSTLETVSKEGIVELAQVADEEEGNVFVELISGSAVSVAYTRAEPVSELKKRLAELPHLSEKFDNATLNLLLDGRTFADHELIEKKNLRLFLGLRGRQYLPVRLRAVERQN